MTGRGDDWEPRYTTVEEMRPLFARVYDDGPDGPTNVSTIWFLPANDYRQRFTDWWRARRNDRFTVQWTSSGIFTLGEPYGYLDDFMTDRNQSRRTAQ